MKKILLALLAAAQIWTVHAQSGSGGTPPYLSKSFASDGITSVESATSGGNIAVFGVPASEARVEVYVWGNRNNEQLTHEEIKRRIDEQYDLIVSVSDHRLTATARRKNNGSDDWRKGLSISFKIYVPEASSTLLKTSGGNISLKKLSGSSHDFKTSGGNLDIDQIGGKINGKTSGGNVDITDSHDDIDITTSGGNIDATKCEGNIRLGTSGGNVSLRLLKGTVRATTSGGNVNGEVIDGELTARTSGGNVKLRDLSCSLNASTSAGTVDVGFKQLGKFVTLSNSGGNIYVRMPSDKGLDLNLHAERVSVSSMQNFKGQTDEHHIEGSINGGGIPVKIDNSGGRISLDLK